jgi:hypothetical protein
MGCQGEVDEYEVLNEVEKTIDCQLQSLLRYILSC